MANEGIFLTKPGTSLPAGTEMLSSAWAGYASNLILARIKNTDHVFNVFEGFKFRAGFVDNVAANVKFTGISNYTPNFVAGSATHNTSTGLITPTSMPVSVEKANTVFLSGANLQVTQIGNDDELTARIASIDGLSHIVANTKTGAVVFTKNGVVDTTDPNTVTTAQIFSITISAAAIVVAGATDGALYSFARTFTAKVASGAIGVLTSSGTGTGSALPFSSAETFEAADSVVNGTLTVESNFGQLTTYTVKLGVAMTAPGGAGVTVLEFTANQSGSHNVTTELSDGIGTKSYSLSSGELPPGMSLTSLGVIQGTPLVDGDYSAFVRVADEYGTEVFIEYSFLIKQSANISYTPHPGTDEVLYEYAPELVGLTNAEITAGVPPTGLTMNATTGALEGTPTAPGTYSFTATFTFDDIEEDVEISMVVYEPLTAELFANSDSAGLVENNAEPEVNLNDDVNVTPSGGSGSYSYSANNGNTIDSNGILHLYNVGTTTITITDNITGESISFSLLVAGQAAICGLAIQEEGDEENVYAPCHEVLTDCKTPVNIAFNAMHIVNGVEAGGTPNREYPNFIDTGGANVINNGKAFSMFKSSTPGGWGVADNFQDGRPKILEFLVDSTIVNSIYNFTIGIISTYTGGGVNSLKYALQITTVSGTRQAQIIKDGVYQSGSRFTTEIGDLVGVGFFGDAVYLYLNGILRFTLSTSTSICSGHDLVFIADGANMIVGGRATNVVYDIETAGTADQVGTIDPQTGIYTPSVNNIALVVVTATSPANVTVLYRTSIRVIKPAMKRSLENALLQGVAVEAYVADLARKDELPLRLLKGAPDRNQFSNIDWVGKFAGSGKLEATPTRTEFTSDTGSVGSGLRIDKAMFTGAALAVRDFELIKRLVPFTVEGSSRGARYMTQKSTGCHKSMRLILVWRSPDCGDVEVWDALEMVNAKSYTMFAPEIGSQVQANLALTIEAFPDDNDVIWVYYQFDKDYNLIGEGS